MSKRHDFTPEVFTLFRQGYGLAALKADIIAGLTVAIVALPLSMALAIASGTSPDKGLVTAVVAGFFISFLGGSRVQIGGPTGAFVVVVASVIAEHGYDGLVMATALAGVILVLAGYARMGQVIKLIPHPVITGFTAGIAVIIASSQVKDFLGLSMPQVPAEFVHKWIAYVHAFSTIHWVTLGVGASSLLLILVLRRVAPRLPGYLIAVFAATLAVSLLQLPVETIGSRFPDLPQGLPVPEVPAFSWHKFLELVPTAVVIAFLAGVESLLSASVADGMTGFRHRPNQELIGQGVANLASALFGGLPATGAIARTATNIKAGGTSPVAGISHAAFVLLFLLFGMHLVAYVPMAVLAAILFVVAYGMSEVHKFIRFLHIPGHDRVVLVLTFALTVLVDLTVAIGVGVTLASLLFMRQMSKSIEFHSGRGQQQTFAEEDQRHELPEGFEVFQMNGPFFFGVVLDFMDTLHSLGQIPHGIILRMRFVPILDASALEALQTIAAECQRNHVTLIFSGLQKQPAMMLRKGKIVPERYPVVFCDTYHAAVLTAQKMVETA